MKRDLPENYLRTTSISPLPSPQQLKHALPLCAIAAQTVADARHEIRCILARGTPQRRLLVIVGPCSIHDPQAALEYAAKLHALSTQLSKHLLIVMRVYLEKPRSCLGWKGLINDPQLDQSCNIAEGLHAARQLLLHINQLGLPCAVECLDPLAAHYLDDLVSWAAIGARTCESQTHRELASALPMPMGFKNSMDGSVQAALNSISAAQQGHAMLGIDQAGHIAQLRSNGNPDGHLVLRGASSGPNSGPNYSASHVALASNAMLAHGLQPNIVIDCSHANAQKQHQRQAQVWHEVLQQIQHSPPNKQNIVGMMLESFLYEGRQELAAASNLQYGVSVTDACLGWDSTEELLHAAYQNLEAQP